MRNNCQLPLTSLQFSRQSCSLPRGGWHNCQVFQTVSVALSYHQHSILNNQISVKKFALWMISNPCPKKGQFVSWLLGAYWNILNLRYDGEGEGESLDSGRQRDEVKNCFSIIQLYNFYFATEKSQLENMLKVLSAGGWGGRGAWPICGGGDETGRK